MAEKGQVTQVKPNNKVVVKMLRTEACAKCRACMTFSSKEMVLEASNECGAHEGDWVELELQQDGFFNAVLIICLLYTSKKVETAAGMGVAVIFVMTIASVSYTHL